MLTADDVIVSNASCTTNCLSPVGQGAERCRRHRARVDDHDPLLHQRSARSSTRCMQTCAARAAAAQSMIPTTTGAARAVGEVLPELKGKLDGSSVRVPTPNVSLVDLTFTPSRDTTKEEVNAVLKAAARRRAEGRARLYRRAAGVASITTIARPAPPSTASKPRCSKASWCACSAGTTTNGASPTAWSIRQVSWQVAVINDPSREREGSETWAGEKA